MNMTPAELMLYVECQQKRYEDMIFEAWHVAALQRVKKLPSLKSLLTPKKKQSVKQKELTVDDRITWRHL